MQTSSPPKFDQQYSTRLSKLSESVTSAGKLITFPGCVLHKSCVSLSASSSNV